jgi:hypothetical protein
MWENVLDAHERYNGDYINMRKNCPNIANIFDFSQRIITRELYRVMKTLEDLDYYRSGVDERGEITYEVTEKGKRDLSKYLLNDKQ